MIGLLEQSTKPEKPKIVIQSALLKLKISDNHAESIADSLIFTSISDIDSLIRENNEEINNGKRNVEDTIESISKIIEGVASINDMMSQIFTDMEQQQSTNRIVNERAGELRIRSDEVRTATEEQRNAVSEIMKSITTINGLTQSSAAGAEEMTGNAGRLASIAEQLKNKVGFFKVLG